MEPVHILGLHNISKNDPNTNGRLRVCPFTFGLTFPARLCESGVATCDWISHPLNENNPVPHWDKGTHRFSHREITSCLTFVMFLLMQQLRHRGSLHWLMFTVFQWCCGPLSSRYTINLCIQSITRKKQFGKFPQRHAVCYSWRLQTQLILSFSSFWLLPRSHLLQKQKKQNAQSTVGSGLCDCCLFL